MPRLCTSVPVSLHRHIRYTCVFHTNMKSNYLLTYPLYWYVWHLPVILNQKTEQYQGVCPWNN